MLTITPGVEFRNRWFSNSENYPTAEGQSGGQWIGYVFGSGLVSAAWGLSWQGRVSYTDSDASYGPYAFHDFSIDLGLPYSFAAPSFAHTGSLWTLTPFGRLFLYPLCGAGPDRFPVHHAHGQTMAGVGNPGYELLPQHRLHAPGPISAHLFDRSELQPAGFPRRGGADLPLLIF